MTIEIIKDEMVKKYKEGKDFNSGGLSFVKNLEWEGMLVGSFLNLLIGVNKETFIIEKVKYS